MGVRGDLRMLETAVRRRWNIDTERAAATVNEALGSDDERIKIRAAAIATVMEGQNQKDEQHFDHLRMDAGRNRILALLGGEGSSSGPLVIEQRTEENAVRSNSKPSPNKPDRKAQGRKRKRTA